MRTSTSSEYVLYFIIMVLSLFIFTVTIIDLGGDRRHSPQIVKPSADVVNTPAE
jgi:hypothetical protein